jgi:hypothetical protein
MPERSKASIQVNIEAGDSGLHCPSAYSLRGPQVEPESSFWLECDIVNGCPVPRPIRLEELQSKFPAGFPHYPTDVAVLKAELEELVMLARLRDEPGDFAHEPSRDAMNKPNPITVEPQQLRLPLSMFLQLRPQPLGAVINTARDGAFPVINSGRELARYFENETPGLQFRLALDYMIREEAWSPPRQAWIWAALDVTIYSALTAAWYLKWRAGTGVAYRPRPWECYDQLDVLFDRVPNSTNSAGSAPCVALRGSTFAGREPGADGRGSPGNAENAGSLCPGRSRRAWHPALAADSRHSQAPGLPFGPQHLFGGGGTIADRALPTLPRGAVPSG